jgi:UrcA family protein
MKTFALIAVAAASLFASAATAQPERADVAVSYADLNLASSAGRAVLARRIETAANAACGVDAGQRDLALSRTAARCHAMAVSSAMERIALHTTTQIASR